MAPRVLFVVDMQRDFMPGGALPVPGGDALVPVINDLLRNGQFDICLASKDNHPQDHISFTSRHPGSHLGDLAVTPSRRHFVEVFHPHCVAGTPGAAFAEGLAAEHIQRTFLKGHQKNAEAHSAFHDMSTSRHSTGLAEYLREQGPEAVYVVGVALEYCVRATVLDSLQEGFDTYLVVDAVAAVDPDKGQQVLEELASKGCKLVHARKAGARKEGAS